MAIILSKLNRFSFFSLEDIFVNLQKGVVSLCAWQCTAKSARDNRVLACNFTKCSLIKFFLLAESAVNLC